MTLQKLIDNKTTCSNKYTANIILEDGYTISVDNLQELCLIIFTKWYQYPEAEKILRSLVSLVVFHFVLYTLSQTQKSL